MVPGQFLCTRLTVSQQLGNSQNMHKPSIEVWRIPQDSSRPERYAAGTKVITDQRACVCVFVCVWLYSRAY